MGDKKTVFTEWLEKLQQESWQLELLISGFAIYGLFALKDFYEESVTSVMHQFELSISGFLLILMIPAYLGILLFISNLLIHVFVRGLWIGAIGLRYVSGDIDYDSLNYNSRFTSYFRKKVGSFDNYIERLEKLASVIFSFTYLLFFLFIAAFAFLFYLMFCSFVLGIIASGEIGDSLYHVSYNVASSRFGMTILTVFIVIHLVLGLIVFIDFITLGFFKKIKNNFLSKLYFWIYRYFGIITLSFLLRPILLNFINNSYTKKLLWMSIPYGIFVAVFIPSIAYVPDAYMPLTSNFHFEYKEKLGLLPELFYRAHYDEEIEKLDLDEEGRFIHYCTIPTKVISGDLLPVFIKKPVGFEHYFMNKDSLTIPFSKIGVEHMFRSSQIENEDRDLQRIEFKLEMKEKRKAFEEQNVDLDKKEQNKRWSGERIKYSKIYNDSIRANDLERVKSVKQVFMSAYTFKLDTQEVMRSNYDCDFYIHPITNNSGMLCYLPLDSLARGRHHLNVSVEEGDRRMKGVFRIDTIDLSIPFVYSRSH